MGINALLRRTPRYRLRSQIVAWDSTENLRFSFGLIKQAHVTGRTPWDSAQGSLDRRQETEEAGVDES